MSVALLALGAGCGGQDSGLAAPRAPATAPATSRSAGTDAPGTTPGTSKKKSGTTVANGGTTKKTKGTGKTGTSRKSSGGHAGTTKLSSADRKDLGNLLVGMALTADDVAGGPWDTDGPTDKVDALADDLGLGSDSECTDLRDRYADLTENSSYLHAFVGLRNGDTEVREKIWSTTDPAVANAWVDVVLDPDLAGCAAKDYSVEEVDGVGDRAAVVTGADGKQAYWMIVHGDILITFTVAGDTDFVADTSAIADAAIANVEANS